MSGGNYNSEGSSPEQRAEKPRGLGRPGVAEPNGERSSLRAAALRRSYPQGMWRGLELHSMPRREGVLLASSGQRGC